MPVRPSIPTLVFLTVLFLASPAADCIASRQLTLTVYNQDLAFVRDRREVYLKKGANEITFDGVSARVDPGSVRISIPQGGAGVRVSAQSYRYDLADLDRMLELGFGRRLLVRTEGGEVTRGVLVGYDSSSLILRETGHSGESAALVALLRAKATEVRFLEPPENLVSRPTLMWQIDSDRETRAELEAAYLTSGLEWRADYAAALGQDEGRIVLSAWATIENRCGASFEDAALTLVAGETHRAAAPVPRRLEMKAAAAEPSFNEGGFFEYHAYTLDGRATIRNNETVQLPLFQPAAVSVERKYTFDGTRFPRGVKVTAETVNSEEKGLGRPLPRGTVKVYAGENEGGRFIGEDELKGTPVGAEIKLELGVAFDVKGERKRTSYTRFGRNSYEESYEIVLKNSKTVPVSVDVIEHPHGDWTITEASHDYEKVDAETVKWTISVPASGEAVLSYTVQIGR